jgi:mono/diheme cytochrome c family protein
MTRRNRLLLAAGCAAALSLCGAVDAARAQDAPAGDAANGKRVYLATGCFECHGRSGQGGAFNGPAPILAKTALPFEAFKAQMRNPSNDMPAYSEKVMPDRQLADIYAYLQALPGPRPVKDISILN